MEPEESGWNDKMEEISLLVASLRGTTHAQHVNFTEDVLKIGCVAQERVPPQSGGTRGEYGFSSLSFFSLHCSAVQRKLESAKFEKHGKNSLQSTTERQAALPDVHDREVDSPV